MAERKVEAACNAKVSDSLRPIVIQHTHQMRTPPPPTFLQRLTPEQAQRLTPEHLHRTDHVPLPRLTPEQIIRLQPELSRLTPEHLQLLLKQEQSIGLAVPSQGKPQAHLSRSPEQIYLTQPLSQGGGGPPHLIRGKPEAMLQLAHPQGKTPPPLLKMVQGAPSPASSIAAELHKPLPELQQWQKFVQDSLPQRISPLPPLDMQGPPPAHSSPATQFLSKSPQPPISSLSVPAYLNQATTPPRRPSPLIPDGQMGTSLHRPHDLQTSNVQMGYNQAQALPKLMGLLTNQGPFAPAGLNVSTSTCTNDNALSQTVNYQSALLKTLNANAVSAVPSCKVSPVGQIRSQLESGFSGMPIDLKIEEEKPHLGIRQQQVTHQSVRLVSNDPHPETRDALDYSKGHLHPVENVPKKPEPRKPEVKKVETVQQPATKPEEKPEDMVADSGRKSPEWDQRANPFSQRVNILTNFPTSTTTYRSTYRSHSVAVHRAKAGSITSAAKSLDILRQNLQKAVNKEIDTIVQKYVEMYFKPATDNIKLNNGENAVSPEHIAGVCRQILEEAKKLYTSETRSCTPVGDVSDTVSEAGSNEKKQKKSALSNFRRRHMSDSDSEASQPHFPYKRKKGRPPAHVSGRATPMKTTKATEPVKREGPKWDPERLKADTLFVMGARANKALGLGATRGRLYIKHPEIFKYSGDQEDKQWLYENSYMPATGGKAYMLLVEDMKELSETDEYRNSPGLMMHILQGFSVPEVMLEKMRSQMTLMRTVKPKSRSVTPSSDQGKDRSLGSLFQDPDNLSDMGVDELDKTLPFSNLKDDKGLLDAKSDVIQPSPANTELELLSTDDQDRDEISPLGMTRAFDYSVSPIAGISPAPSDLDALDDGGPLTAPFDFTD